MSKYFLIENDKRLARALFREWYESYESPTLAQGLELYDRIFAIEMRTTDSAQKELYTIIKWLYENGLQEHERHAEIEKQLGLMTPVNNTPKEPPAQKSPTDSNIATEPAADGRVNSYEQLIVSAEHALNQSVESPWEAFEKAGVEQFVDDYGAANRQVDIQAETTRIAVAKLPWHPKVDLIRLADPTWSHDGIMLYYLRFENNLYQLNGTAPPIHEVNGKTPIQLSDENVIEYLKFFCFFVRGEEGPFYVLEQSDDPLLTKDGELMLPENAASQIKPAVYRGRNSNGQFLCDAFTYYSNAIFIVKYAVHENGMVEMLDDEPVASDLPLKLDYPLNTYKKG